MRKYMSVLAFLVLSTGFVPSAQAEGLVPSNVISYCEGLGEMANRIMTARQGGATVGYLLESVGKMEKKFDMPQHLRKKLDSIALSSFEEPMFQTQSYKERVINDFSNNVEFHCIKNLLNK